MLIAGMDALGWGHAATQHSLTFNLQTPSWPMKIPTLPVLLLVCMGLTSTAQAVTGGDKFTILFGYRLDADADLKSIANDLGPAPIVTSGDAAGFEARLCYLLPKGSLSFLSGELDGSAEPGQYYLAGLELSEAAASADCKPLRNLVKAAISVGGLHIGMSRAEFMAVVDGHVTWKGDIAERLFESKVRISPKDIARLKPGPDDPKTYDLSISIDARFASDRLVDLTVWKTTTN